MVERRPFAVALGQMIRRTRQEKRWSAAGLAVRMGVSTPAVICWENGTRMPPLNVFVTLADLLGLDSGVLARIGPAGDVGTYEI